MCRTQTVVKGGFIETKAKRGRLAERKVHDQIEGGERNGRA